MNKPNENKPEPDKMIRMTGACSIQAGIAPKVEGEKPKLPTVEMEVYNGGKMNVSYYGPVVVDLAGMTVSDVTPILYGHRSYSLDDVIGQTSKVKTDGGKLSASGAVMGDSDTVTKMMTLAGNGYKFQASMGADPVKMRDVPEGETVEVNGQSIDGPFTLVSQSTLYEVSILPLGADGTTSAAVAASQTTAGETTMKGQDQEPTAESIRAAAVAEEKRILEVRDVAKNHPKISAQAVTDGWDKAQTRIAVIEAENADLKAQIEAAKVQGGRPIPPGVTGGKDGPTLTARAVEAAACLRAGLKNVESQFDADTLTMANDLKVRSFTDLVRASLAIEGKPLDATRHDTREFLQAAFSTRSIANVLSNVANKFIAEGFATVEEVWRMVAGVRSVVDFKANTGVRLVMANLLKTLSPAGEIQHGVLSDETRSIQADTKALMLAVTRKDIINDDLGVLSDIPRKLGFAAARTFNTDFWKAFTDALATAFPTDESKGNYLNVALSLASMRTAVQAFMKLKDSDNNPIGANASVLLVSPENAVLADEIYTSKNLVGGGTKSTGENTHAGRYVPAATRYLSGNGWALVANPLAIPMMEAAFLNGRQEPYVETADTDFNTLGIQMRCWYDYGVAFAEDKAAVYSAGG